MAFRPLHVETPEERLRRENEELRAGLREALDGWQRAVDNWGIAEERLDLWMPLGAITLAAVVTAVLGWIAGWV